MKKYKLGILIFDIQVHFINELVYLCEHDVTIFVQEYMFVCVCLFAATHFVVVGSKRRELIIESKLHESCTIYQVHVL